MSLVVKGVTVPEKKGLYLKNISTDATRVRYVLNSAGNDLVWMAQRLRWYWWRDGTSKTQKMHFLNESDEQGDAYLPFGGEYRFWWTNASGSVGKDSGWYTLPANTQETTLSYSGSGTYTYMNYDLRIFLDSSHSRFSRFYKTQVSTSNGSSSGDGTMTTAGFVAD